jgi:hypothetical protein
MAEHLDGRALRRPAGRGRTRALVGADVVTAVVVSVVTPVVVGATGLLTGVMTDLLVGAMTGLVTRVMTGLLAGVVTGPGGTGRQRQSRDQGRRHGERHRTAAPHESVLRTR